MLVAKHLILTKGDLISRSTIIPLDTPAGIYEGRNYPMSSLILDVHKYIAPRDARMQQHCSRVVKAQNAHFVTMWYLRP